MEEKIFEKYLQEYIEVHNELIDVVEKERLERIMEEKLLMLKREYYQPRVSTENVQEQSKSIVTTMGKYIEEIEDLKKQINGLEEKMEKGMTSKELEDRQNGIRQKAREEKDRILEEENKPFVDEIAELSDKEASIEQEFNEISNNKNVKSMSMDDLEKMKELIDKSNDVRDKKEKKQGQLTNRISKLKFEAEYDSFLRLLNMTDQHKDKISMKGIMKEQEEKLKQQQEKNFIGKNDRKEILGKIEKVQQSMKDANRDYKNIFLDESWELDHIDLSKTNSDLQSGQQQGKNGQEGQEQGGNGTRPDFHPPVLYQGTPQKTTVTSISINEKDGKARVITSDSKKHDHWIESTLRHKGDNYTNLKVKELCREIAGGRVKGVLLGAKVNPTIVHILREDPEAVKNYIECLHNKKELPFELSHDLTDSKLGIIEKMKMAVRARAEDKIPGTKITFAKRIWNKNKTLQAPKNVELPEKEDKLADIRNVIPQEQQAQNAEKILKEQEAERAKQVQEAMRDDDQQQEETK